MLRGLVSRFNDWRAPVFYDRVEDEVVFRGIDEEFSDESSLAIWIGVLVNDNEVELPYEVTDPALIGVFRQMQDGQRFTILAETNIGPMSGRIDAAAPALES